MANESKVRVGVIGAGGISQVSHIPNLQSEPAADLVAVCDMDVRRAVSVAERYQIPAWFDDPERMVRQVELDCVLIATPTISHLPLCQIAMESGVDVIVEKPFARNLDEAQRIVKIAESSGRLVMVAMNHRFREDTIYLKKTLDSEGLGELFMVRSGWLRRLGVWGRPYWFTDPKLAGGGVLYDLGLQMIDLVLFLLDFPTAIEVNCGTSNHVLGLEVEDTASAFIRFSDGVTFLLAVSWANCHDHDVAYTYFDGSHGGASLNPMRMSRRHGDRIIQENIPRLDDEVDLYRASFRTEISHFIECVQNRQKPLSSGADALYAIDVIEQLYKSSGS